MPWFQDRLGTTWIWIKEKGRWVVMAVAIALLGSAAVNQILQEEPIPMEYVLKASKEKILLSKEIDWIVRHKDGTFENKGRIISYDYISNKEVKQIEKYGIKEDMSKRTGNAQFFKRGIVIENGEEREEWTAKVYVGTPFFYIPHENKWYQTETATTTIKDFKKQMKVSWFEKTFGVLATATTTYTGAGDGHVYEYENNTWAYTHAQTASGEVVDATATTGNSPASQWTGSAAGITRTFFPTYTAGIPADAVISTTTFYAWFDQTANCDNDGDDWVNVIGETSQADHTTLEQEDFDQCGSVDNPTEYSDDRKDATDMGTGQYYTWSFNATGRSAIKKSGEASACGSGLTGWTCLGVRDGHDCLNHAMTCVSNTFTTRYSEYAGTGSDPYLTITYSIPVAAEDELQGSWW